MNGIRGILWGLLLALPLWGLLLVGGFVIVYAIGVGWR